MLYHNYNTINSIITQIKLILEENVCFQQFDFIHYHCSFMKFLKIDRIRVTKALHVTTWRIRITKQHVSYNLRRSQSVISLDNGQLTASKETVNPNSGIGKCGRFSRNRVDSIETRCKLLPLQPINARRMRPLGGCDPINHGKSVKDFKMKAF